MTRKDTWLSLSLLVALVVLQACILKVQANIRSDQLTIRHWIAHELKARRAQL